MLVYSTGQGVHGFTLDPTVGEFLLSHPHIRIPNNPLYFSANMGYRLHWTKSVQRYTDYLQGEGQQIKPLSLRYVGSLVADFHRNLLTGRRFLLSGGQQEPFQTVGKTAPVIRSISVGIPGGTGGWLCLQR